MNAVQTTLTIAGYALPVDPVRLAADNIFEVRHQLRALALDDEQIQAAEAAVEMARRGEYPGAAR
ncbi:MAG TPA: hypothetical protein VKA90_03745 [Beijerinckiaceae bacterium]|nr:hypothetical protein [Beijerinckiaceae bacterium]